MASLSSEIRWLGRWGSWLLGLAAVAAVFTDLGEFTLRQWDEARLAVSALEMTRSGNLLVTTFGTVPDLWSTKPPLMIWLQAAAISLLGPTEWAVRLPAALAALATVGLLYWFVARHLRRPVAGLVAGSALISSLGFMGGHHAHTGDYDALLTLAGLLTGCSLLVLLQTGRSRWWLGVAAGLIIGTLTKGIAALLPLPAVGLYWLLQPQGRRLLRRPGMWLALLAWGGVSAGWYLLREKASPGYWAAVGFNELGGRFSAAAENHTEPWYYYLKGFFKNKFVPWAYVLPFAAVFALRYPDFRVRQAAQLALIWAVGLLLVLSTAKTKMEWYAIPAYPWLAMIMGLGAPRLANYLLRIFSGKLMQTGLRALFLAFLVVPPAFATWHELRGYRRDALPDLRLGYGLRALQQTPLAGPLFVVAPAGFYTSLRPPDAVGGGPGYNASLRFYVLTHPQPVRVVAPAALAALRGPGYILTSAATDSARVRQVFPRASCRAVGRYTCWLWMLPAN